MTQSGQILLSLFVYSDWTLTHKITELIRGVYIPVLSVVGCRGLIGLNPIRRTDLHLELKFYYLFHGAVLIYTQQSILFIL